MDQKIKFKLLSTEKTHLLRSNNQIVLQTRTFINKKDITLFLENTFDVKVKNVNSMIQHGKVKFRRRHRVQLPDRKKFIITVDNLDKFEKVEQKDVEAV